LTQEARQGTSLAIQAEAAVRCLGGSMALVVLFGSVRSTGSVDSVQVESVVDGQLAGRVEVPPQSFVHDARDKVAPFALAASVTRAAHQVEVCAIQSGAQGAEPKRVCQPVLVIDADDCESSGPACPPPPAPVPEQPTPEPPPPACALADAVPSPAGWSFWSDLHAGEPHSYQLNGTGSCIDVSGDFDVLAVEPMHAHDFGAEQPVELCDGTVLTFDYRVTSGWPGSTVTNLSFDLLDPGGNTLQSERLVAGGMEDTGWRSHSIALRALDGTHRLRFRMRDAWTADWNERFQVCNARFHLAGVTP
jgi:hypothetical protein